ncbi:hypothetical protein [Pectinatus sottacetonis]|uniref:hypothetical protein n=1 Tax=Pectinatus sottacetonis TaxID=1002795 RepID=UPI001E41F0B9|nr:hypothetical protein [Pectinatus sottacetonis]
MNTINSINSLSSLLDSYVTPKTSSKSMTTTSSSTVSGTAGKSSGNDSSSSDDATVTTTRVLSDGSMLIVVTKGDKIISETKTAPPATNNLAQNLSGASQSANQLDKFNDSSASSITAAGSLFDTDI